MAHGFPWHDAESGGEFKDEAWWAYMFRKFSLTYQSYGIGKETADLLSRKVRELILEANSYKVYEDAVETLCRCKEKGYKNFILSNNYPELQSVMKKLELSDYFTGFIVSGTFGYDKPREEIFRYALKVAGTPDVAFMIGDNPFADIEGGLRVGMKTVLVHNNAESRADYTLCHLANVVELL